MRVAFAVATAFVPDILLVDEALSVGDVSFQAKCFARIEAMRADGCALLYVSHSVEDVVKHCKRALFVDAGHLLADAPSRDVANAYLDHVWGARRAIAPAAASTAVPAGAMDGPGTGYESRPHYRTEEYRWGNGGARITDFYFEVDGEAFAAPVRAGARFRIVMRVDFERDVDEPVYGLLIRTHDGVFLFGTNSRIASKTPVPPVRKGGRADVEFVLAGKPELRRVPAVARRLGTGPRGRARAAGSPLRFDPHPRRPRQSGVGAGRPRSALSRG